MRDRSPVQLDLMGMSTESIAPTKLTDTQWKMLNACVADPRGIALAPGGYPEAGRDASRFYRTHSILNSLGLTTRAGEQSIKITEKGRKFYALFRNDSRHRSPR